MEKTDKGLYTMLGEGCVLEGVLMAPHSVRIDGIIRGARLEVGETLTIGNEGVVEVSSVKAKHAIVGGKIVGNVHAEERIELEANASLCGDLTTRNLIINEGAVFQGSCSMESTSGAKPKEVRIKKVDPAAAANLV